MATNTNHTLQVYIVSAEQEIFSGLAQLLTVNGDLGQLGLTPGHTPLLTCVKPGELRILQPKNVVEVFYISGGILEVQSSTVTILADTVVRAAELDEAAAMKAKERAEQSLIGKRSTIEYANALAELARATAQLRVIRNNKTR